MINKTVKYFGMKSSDSIEKRINDRLKSIEKFLHDGHKVNLSVRDLTPKKNKKANEYEIILDIKNVEKGKNVVHSIHHKDRDLYRSIDKAIDMIKEQLRRSHDKNSSKFRQVKSVLFDRSKDMILENYNKFFKKKSLNLNKKSS